MHMANELLTPGVAAGFGAASAAGIAYSSWRVRRELDDSKVPLMGVMGAFVFAAQMVNFQILPGSSGHLGGGVLLAILLGPSAATLVMAAILIVQCLVFNDGGLLALGANIFNMGIVPCYLASTSPASLRLSSACWPARRWCRCRWPFRASAPSRSKNSSR